MKTLRVEQHIFLDRSICVVDARDIEKLFEAIDDQHPELEVKENCMYMESVNRDGHLEHHFKDSFTRESEWLRLDNHQYEIEEIFKNINLF